MLLLSELTMERAQGSGCKWLSDDMPAIAGRSVRQRTITDYFAQFVLQPHCKKMAEPIGSRHWAALRTQLAGAQCRATLTNLLGVASICLGYHGYAAFASRCAMRTISLAMSSGDSTKSMQPVSMALSGMSGWLAVS